MTNTSGTYKPVPGAVIPTALRTIKLRPEVEYKLYTPPQPVGYWTFGGTPDGMFRTQFPVFTKPTPEHIKNHEALLGWVWEDAK